MENESIDSVAEYFKQLAEVSNRMNREEMASLWARVKKGDAEAKNILMEQNLRLVVPTAKRFLRPGMELMDLVEEGNLGLLQAIEKFDSSKGYRFSTYAVYWIEQYIRKYIEEQSGSIKIPSHAWGNLKKWFKAWSTLREANGRDPSLSEMAAELNLTARQVHAIMDTLSAATGVDSLSALSGEEDEMTLEDKISDDGKGNPHDVFSRGENMRILQESLMNLNERDREILTLRFGLADNEPKTLGEVATIMGLSRERVRQIEERAVREMRTAARRAGLLEVNTEDHRTRQLHAGLPVRKKTNILGEVVDNSPLSRMLRRYAAQQAQKKEQKEAVSAPKKASKKPAVKAAVSKKTAKTAPAKKTAKAKPVLKKKAAKTPARRAKK